MHIKSTTSRAEPTHQQALSNARCVCRKRIECDTFGWLKFWRNADNYMVKRGDESLGHIYKTATNIQTMQWLRWFILLLDYGCNLYVSWSYVIYIIPKFIAWIRSLSLSLARSHHVYCFLVRIFSSSFSSKVNVTGSHVIWSAASTYALASIKIKVKPWNQHTKFESNTIIAFF